MDVSYRSLTARSSGALALGPRVLRRLWRMPAREIAHRSWQQASKWHERLTFGGPGISDVEWLRMRAPALATPEHALEMLRVQLPQRFFAGAADALLPASIAGRFPEATARIIAAAEEALAGRFDVLGYRSLSFGRPIDWHLDPVSSRRAPFVHWSRLDPLDALVVGDNKVVWELNRHQWLVGIAQAWSFTRDDRFARACVDVVDDWRRANPVGAGINWASSLEVAYRLIAWCWIAVLIRHSRAVRSEWAMGLLASIGQHAAHVRRHLSYYYSPNTHLTGEAMALFYAGVLLPEYDAAADWRATATRVLVDASVTQVTADGVHFEQSTCYHAYTVEMFLHLRLLAAHNRVPLPSHMAARLEQMVDYLAAVRLPDGSMPSIGDDDGGRLLPLAPRSAADRRELFALAAVVCNRPDFAWAAGGSAPEVDWLTGRPGAAALDALRPQPPESGSRLFASGGYAVMRSGWAPDAHHLIMDVGPLGCPTSSGHGHADLLSVQCAAFGEPFLVDAGTCCYTAVPRWRDFFRSTAAHSTVRIDGREQADPAGPFQWHRRPRAWVRAWESSVDLDLLDAEHDAYRHLPDPVVCRRRVAFVKPDYWVIVDDISGGAAHHVEVAFQFSPDVAVEAIEGNWARARGPRGGIVWLWSTHGSLSLRHGQDEPPRGWVSYAYGQRRPATLAAFAARVPLPCRVVSVLVPDAGATHAPPPLRTEFDDTGRPCRLHLPPHRALQIDRDAVALLENPQRSLS